MIMQEELDRMKVANRCLGETVRSGLNEVRVHVTVAGEADEATLLEMVSLGWNRSPMRGSIEHGVTMMPTVTVV